MSSTNSDSLVISFQFGCPYNGEKIAIVQSPSHVWLFVTPQIAAHQASPSPFPKVYPSSCPLHQGCHSAISSSDAFFSSCPQSFPASGTFPKSQLFASDDQNTGVSASASVLLMSIQGWFPFRLASWSSCCPAGSQESTPTPQFEGINSSALHLLVRPETTKLLEEIKQNTDVNHSNLDAFYFFYFSECYG